MRKPERTTCSSIGVDVLCWLGAVLGLILAGLVLAVSIIVALTAH